MSDADPVLVQPADTPPGSTGRVTALAVAWVIALALLAFQWRWCPADS